MKANKIVSLLVLAMGIFGMCVVIQNLLDSDEVTEMPPTAYLDPPLQAKRTISYRSCDYELPSDCILMFNRHTKEYTVSRANKDWGVPRYITAAYGYIGWDFPIVTPFTDSCEAKGAVWEFFKREEEDRLKKDFKPVK